MMQRNLFVYGTLRKKLNNDWYSFLARRSEYLGEGYFKGKLYDLGAFPGVTVSYRDTDRVYGEVYVLEDPEGTLPHLDQYEGCGGADALYTRQLATIVMENGDSLEAWVYVFNHSVAGFKRIESGDYVQYLAELEAEESKTNSNK